MLLSLKERNVVATEAVVTLRESAVCFSRGGLLRDGHGLFKFCEILIRLFDGQTPREDVTFGVKMDGEFIAVRFCLMDLAAAYKVAEYVEKATDDVRSFAHHHGPGDLVRVSYGTIQIPVEEKYIAKR